MNAKRDNPQKAEPPEREEIEDHEGKWSKADTWLGILFLLLMLGVGATGLLTLMRAAGRMH